MTHNPSDDAAMGLGDYPLVEIPDVQPIFVRQMMLGAMAIQYVRAAGLTFEEGLSSARATWDTDWESDPKPRSFESAVEEVSADLECWEGDI